MAEIAKNRISSYYSDQIQTGLALSGESVNKGLFVDNYFRICSLKQIESSPSHNPIINGGKVYQSKDGSTLAWGICYLFVPMLVDFVQAKDKWCHKRIK